MDGGAMAGPCRCARCEGDPPDDWEDDEAEDEADDAEPEQNDDEEED